METSLHALSPNALRILEARYLRRNAAGEIVESPAQLFERVARAVAQAEGTKAGEWADRFLTLLESLDFLPNSPTLMNAGTALGQLSACFVLPVEDTMEGIFDALRGMALVQRTGGGTGFSFSRLRPGGDLVSSTCGRASGPVSFMKIFDCATQNIRQGGRRRGANMGVLRVDHPDILEFIAAKDEDSALQTFNLSVAAPDSFMEAVRGGKPYELIHPRTGLATRRLPAREVFERIAQSAWRTGDPGLLFLDAIERANPTPGLGKIEATNPCGEVPLLPFEACTLGSVNLSHMVREGNVDWDRLRHTVGVAVRFLDDIVEANRWPLPEIERVGRANRKIGLGVMGFAEMLLRLEVSYDSENSVRWAEQVMHAVSEAALDASRALAEERGPFPNWGESIYAERGIPIRNATRTAIAPTGTISILAGTTASIEPLFALAYRRRALDGQVLSEVNPIFEEAWRRLTGAPESMIHQIMERGGLDADSGVPPELRRLFATALEIPPERHLEIQAAFQNSVDNSVSKTINLLPETSSGEVARILQRAWELGLKGITVYRYGSRPGQVLELGTQEEPEVYEHGAPCDPGECRV